MRHHNHDPTIKHEWYIHTESIITRHGGGSSGIGDGCGGVTSWPGAFGGITKTGGSDNGKIAMRW